MVFAAALALGVVAVVFYYFLDDKPMAKEITADSVEGDYVYMDITELSDIFHTKDKDMNYCLAHGNSCLVIVKVDKADFDLLKMQNEQWYNSTDEPKSTRVYGKLLAPNEDAEEKLNSYDELRPFRWSIRPAKVNLFVGVTPYSDIAIISAFFGFFAMVAALLLRLGTSHTRKIAEQCLKHLEDQEEMEKAAAELENSGISSSKIVMTENYLFFKHKGVAVPLKEIVWVYGDNAAFHIYTKNYMDISPLFVTNKRGVFDGLIKALGERLPNVKTGYGADLERWYCLMYPGATRIK